jgi:asparagine synthase (glutamine-hydrolysing)
VCGIAGFLAPPGQRADRAMLERLVRTLTHRGPDAIGLYVEGPAALGVARLRVIDLVTGDQPIGNEDGSVHVALNGEIYGFAALRQTLRRAGHRFRTGADTEVIVHAWEEYGEYCPDHFNGMFGFAVWDRHRETLFLARDRMGEKPLYYAAVDGWVVFGSELRAVLAHPHVGRALDPAGLARYLAYDFVPDPHAIVRDVAKLPPGHALTAGDGKLRVQRYWELPAQPDAAGDEAMWRREIVRRLDDAVALRLVSDVPLGCFLSGGIDSTAVAASAARLKPGLRTFSVGYAERAHDERGFARLAASRLGTEHRELLVAPADVPPVLERLGALLDEPIADMSFVPLYLLSAMARRDVTVALTGDGGDELFGGYPAMAADWWHRRFALLPRRACRAVARLAAAAPAPEPLRLFLGALAYAPEARNQPLLGGLPPERLAALLSPAARATLAEFDPYGDIDAALASCASDDPATRMIHRYCKLYLAGQNLANADRASMAVGLELRAPFLDHTFVGFVSRIPASARLEGLTRLKRLLKEALADRLPPEILRRGKHGFGVPFMAWFRGPLAGLLRQTLAPERLAASGIFDVAAVERLVAEHLAGRRDHARPLWSLFVFERWRLEHLGVASGL